MHSLYIHYANTISSYTHLLSLEISKKKKGWTKKKNRRRSVYKKKVCGGKGKIQVFSTFFFFLLLVDGQEQHFVVCQEACFFAFYDLDASDVCFENISRLGHRGCGRVFYHLVGQLPLHSFGYVKVRSHFQILLLYFTLMCKRGKLF